MITFLCRVTAGANVWLTCCISIDRLLIVYYHANYITKETKRRVVAKIAAVIVAHGLAGLYWNFIHYLPAAVTAYVDPLEKPAYDMVFAQKPFTAAVQPIDISLTVLRLVADRLIPWLLCPATYLAVFVLRKRQKLAVQQAPTLTAGNTEARQRAERRIRRSRKLVIGISASVFVSLLPETVLDFSKYAVGIDLRARAPVVGMIWYLANIVDPIICIVSLPSLSKKAGIIFVKVGLVCSSAVQKVALGGTTGGSQK